MGRVIEAAIRWFRRNPGRAYLPEGFADRVNGPRDAGGKGRMGQVRARQVNGDNGGPARFFMTDKVDGAVTILECCKHCGGHDTFDEAVAHGVAAGVVEHVAPCVPVGVASEAPGGEPNPGADAPADQLRDRVPEVKPGDVLETTDGSVIRIGSDTPVDVLKMESRLPCSQVKATCARIVHVYSNRWRGPRPGVVVCGWGVSADTQLINVNVFLDGANDTKVLAEFRARPDGNTLTSVPLYDALDDEQRGQLLLPAVPGPDNPPRYHCEWPPRN
jgi:hypothetical protein